MVEEKYMSKIKVNLDALKPKREWVRHKVEEGNNIFRFLPPFGEEANGYPYRRWMVIWGLNDPDSGRLRPYASPITSDEKACPVMEFVKALQEKAETLKSELKAQGASDEQVKDRLKALNKTIGSLRPKGVYAWNAVDKAGKVGLLEIKSTAQKKLKALMSDYINDYGQDPTSVNSADDDSGVWFNIKRTGKGFDTEYDVEKVQQKQKVNGSLTFVDDRSPLPDSVVENWQDQAYDLASIYQRKSYDEIRNVLMANLADIVSECPDAGDIPGFSLADHQLLEDQTHVQDSAPASAPAQKPAGSKPITTRFDDDDDEDGEDVIKASAPKSTPAPKAGDDDIFALADGILND